MRKIRFAKKVICMTALLSMILSFSVLPDVNAEKCREISNANTTKVSSVSLKNSAKGYVKFKVVKKRKKGRKYYTIKFLKHKMPGKSWTPKGLVKYKIKDLIFDPMDPYDTDLYSIRITGRLKILQVRRVTGGGYVTSDLITMSIYCGKKFIQDAVWYTNDGLIAGKKMEFETDTVYLIKPKTYTLYFN